MITLFIIPYCTVLSLGEVSFQLHTAAIGRVALTAPVVKFIVVLRCGAHEDTAGTLNA